MSRISIDQTISEIAANADKLPGVVTIHNLRDWSIVWMSDRGLKGLNVTAEEIIGKTSDEYHNRFFNPEDAKDYVPKILELLQRNNDDEILTFFQQVRRDNNTDWTWHMSSVKILLRDEEELPLLAISMSFPIDAMHHMTTKASRLLEENNFLRKNFHIYSKLSSREREILRLMALGKSSGETAEELFISQNTVETHRKNIRQKLNTNSYYEVCQYARAFDLI
ncbi:response regulator transcription factor [Pedobacter frigoris]|uniref:Helix-turn-helix transcriptional regulator n=1 Tax=Pedobacter frigoris TaxID=2571272 RepID=A0A4V5P0K9_9SPHI|nr:helix-turn-helix transcriptional regulator [Pedobacter frigoris]TKC05239.1 helix-turn-helix transcriptional regulator [Pedobacter frigoris]